MTTFIGQASRKPSGNRKTGPIPVTSRGQDTCPVSCPLMGAGCYGESGIGGGPFVQAAKYSAEHDVVATAALWARFPATRKAIVRDRVVGDLETPSGDVDRAWLATIARTAVLAGRRAFGYTHHLRATAQDVPADGYTLNASCETPDDVRNAWSRGLPAVVAGDVFPDNVDGTRVVICPATQREDVTCASCGLCANASRMADPRRAPIVRFPIHGTGSRKARAAVAARNGRSS